MGSEEGITSHLSVVPPVAPLGVLHFVPPRTGQADHAPQCLLQECSVIAGTVPVGPDHHWRQLGHSATAAAKSVFDSAPQLQYPGVFCGVFAPRSIHPVGSFLRAAGVGCFDGNSRQQPCGWGLAGVFKVAKLVAVPSRILESMAMGCLSDPIFSNAFGSNTRVGVTGGWPISAGPHDWANARIALKATELASYVSDEAVSQLGLDVNQFLTEEVLAIPSAWVTVPWRQCWHRPGAGVFYTDVGGSSLKVGATVFGGGLVGRPYSALAANLLDDGALLAEDWPNVLARPSLDPYGKKDVEIAAIQHSLDRLAAWGSEPCFKGESAGSLAEKTRQLLHQKWQSSATTNMLGAGQKTQRTGCSSGETITNSTTRTSKHSKSKNKSVEAFSSSWELPMIGAECRKLLLYSTKKQKIRRGAEVLQPTKPTPNPKINR
ncbi:hypothetical protein Salat_0514300 [Sesamum alatum]|uniref:Uncharacterized protein n=1 Tax=Sesamum alatum TaxID=300844 RepID=A0AAE1Z407_9LAMI|nr:hypothetical protein Salat_0514300 [Sesamum alatum]